MEDSLPFPDLDTDTTTSFAQLWNDTITEVDFGMTCASLRSVQPFEASLLPFSSDMGEFFQQMEGNVRNVSNDHSYSQHSGQSEQDTETTGMEGQQDRVTSSVTSGPSATSSDVPSTTVYPGPFSFQVAFPPQTLKPKSKKLAWTWSQPCKMLYADFNKICPFNFKTVRPPPAGCLIRAMPVYLKHEHIGLPVKRCPTHRENDFNNADPPAHFLHCRGKAVEYREDPTTGRHSVIIPYEHPQAGTEWSTIPYKFMSGTEWSTILYKFMSGTEWSTILYKFMSGTEWSTILYKFMSGTEWSTILYKFMSGTEWSTILYKFMSGTEWSTILYKFMSGTEWSTILYKFMSGTEWSTILYKFMSGMEWSTILYKFMSGTEWSTILYKFIWYGVVHHPVQVHVLLLKPVYLFWYGVVDHPVQVHVLLLKPVSGTEWSTILYKFMCRSTCLNRRSMAVVFTLEDSRELVNHGFGHTKKVAAVVLGRQAVKIKICSCPGRDREQDEEALLPQPAPGSKKRLMTDSKTSQKKRKKTSVSSGGGGANDWEVFTVNWQIRGRKNYETLLRVKEALEVQHRCETDPQVAALLRTEDEQTDQQQPRPPTEPTPTDQTANQSTAVTRPANQSTAVTRPANQSTSVARPASQGSVRYTLRRTVSKPKTWE
ncbi:TP63 [Branchiostoma lanceolatum]|uniref:TP63 protein n=1 Tax=Branchiostoma lanceolatum TaxID=7740 RepID=A0A8J9Z1F2_BRALA|nr:TP63 [Branchiostoma lanceolatum]